MYDKVKAHEYYMKHRKLKGRISKKKITGAKTSERKRKRKTKYTAPKNIALMTKNGSGHTTKVTDSHLKQLKAKLVDIKERAVNLPPDEKKALKMSLNAIKGHIEKKGKG